MILIIRLELILHTRCDTRIKWSSAILLRLLYYSLARRSTNWAKQENHLLYVNSTDLLKYLFGDYSNQYLELGLS